MNNPSTQTAIPNNLLYSSPTKMSAASYVVTGLALIAAYWTSIKSMAIPPVASEKERSVTGGKGYVLTVRYYNTLLK